MNNQSLYSIVMHNEKTIYLHGIPHPFPMHPLQPKFLEALSKYINKSIDEGEIWYGEEGLGNNFGVERIIPLSVYSSKVVMPQVISFSLEEMANKQKDILRMIEEMRKNIPVRQLFAEQMTILSDLQIYRSMYEAPERLISDVALFNNREKPIAYEKFIDKMMIEIRGLMEIPNEMVHYLCGIAHEAALTLMEWGRV